eukprot:gene20693-24799_t
MADKEEPTVEKGEEEVEKEESKKHPLENNWVLWFDNPTGRQKQSTWGQTLRSVYTFDTVEDFWCLHNNIVAPSRLVVGSDFSMFKQGIEPKWEDAANSTGGKWTFMIPKSASKTMLDTYWLNTLLALIGEQYDDTDDICGVVVNVGIGRQFKAALELPESSKIGYIAHDDSLKMDKKAREKKILDFGTKTHPFLESCTGDI